VLAAQRSARAFEPLYLRYRDRVINYCYYRLGDREEAEDAASAVFVKALDHLAAFRDQDDSFRSWLFRLAHNEVVDRHRRRTRHPERSLAGAVELTDAGRTPEELAVEADGRQRMLALLTELPPRERAVLELRTADLATAEIAGILGISEQNVRTAQCRAISRLRDLMAAPGAVGRRAADG
jgi:RNA polymerase sigma-70 factor (ECF subfamily)